eukprot:gene2564-3526_t
MNILQRVVNYIYSPPEKAISNQNKENVQEENTKTIATLISEGGFGFFQIFMFIICGLSWGTADATEIMLLSFLGPSITQYWNLENYHKAILNSVVFTGMFFGAFFWGFASDRFGRKIALLWSIVITAAFGIISALCPNFWTLVLSRGFVGFGVSGGHIAFSFCSEFLDTRVRGIIMVLFNTFWFFGTVSESIAAWILLTMKHIFGDFGFRFLIAFSALPAIITLLAFPFIPESPRYLMISGKKEEAKNVIKYIYKLNCKSLPETFEIKDEKTNQQKGNFFMLFSKAYWLSTILLFFQWFSISFSYYGVVILMPEFFKRHNVNVYLESLISALAEIPGMILAATLINLIGRKKTQAVLFFLTGLFLALILIPLNEYFIFSFAVIARGAVFGAFAAIYAYTPEMYPTIIRSIGLGSCGSVSRLGGMATPFFSNLLSEISPYIPMVCYSLICFASTVVALLLPYETKGMNLVDSIEAPSSKDQNKDEKTEIQMENIDSETIVDDIIDRDTKEETEDSEKKEQKK